MRHHSAFAMLAALVGLVIGQSAFSATAIAQARRGGIDCSSFIKNADGSWTVIQRVFIPVQNVRVEEGTVFRPGGTFLGDDMAARLSKECPNQPIAEPVPQPGAAAPAPSPPPRLSLAQLADGNGNIDVRRLTCGQIADTSAEESQIFLAWYSGWYSGRGKKSEINPARVRYIIHNVTEYCKVYRDKKVSDVIELWLR